MQQCVEVMSLGPATSATRGRASMCAGIADVNFGLVLTGTCARADVQVSMINFSTTVLVRQLIVVL